MGNPKRYVPYPHDTASHNEHGGWPKGGWRVGYPLSVAPPAALALVGGASGHLRDLTALLRARLAAAAAHPAVLAVLARDLDDCKRINGTPRPRRRAQAAACRARRARRASAQPPSHSRYSGTHT